MSTEGVYDGQNWPTHSIAVWVENDVRFAETARNYARLDETGAELRGYMHRLLFDRGALASEERRRLTRDSVRTLDAVVGELPDGGDGASPQEAFDTVNWQYVCAELLAE
jgi:hypothetical protein